MASDALNRFLDRLTDSNVLQASVRRILNDTLTALVELANSNDCECSFEEMCEFVSGNLCEDRPGTYQSRELLSQLLGDLKPVNAEDGMFKTMGVDDDDPELQMELMAALAAAKKKGERSPCWQVLRNMDLFQSMNDDQIDRLMADGTVRDFTDGNVVVQQGDLGSSMFAIADGSVSVWVESETSGSHEVAKLSDGSFFGEMSLLTGEPRKASVLSSGQSQVVEITKKAIDPLLRDVASLTHDLAIVMAKRMAATDGTLRDADVRAERERSLVARIGKFFGLG